MDDQQARPRESLKEILAAKGYWPAEAAHFLSEGKYSRVVELCRENIPAHPYLVSARLVYAQALYYTGQMEVAEKEFHHVLSQDPDNIVALRFLGDIKTRQNDQFGAKTNYQRILQLDPDCQGVKSERAVAADRSTTRTITLTRKAEASTKSPKPSLREIPFCTETVGDLYLAQGHLRMASEVFRALDRIGHNPRIHEKLLKTEKKLGEKDRQNVSKTD
jgi:tetratricopeptide (TPR) repeat protein